MTDRCHAWLSHDGEAVTRKVLVSTLGLIALVVAGTAFSGSLVSLLRDYFATPERLQEDAKWTWRERASSHWSLTNNKGVLEVRRGWVEEVEFLLEKGGRWPLRPGRAHHLRYTTPVILSISHPNYLTVEGKEFEGRYIEILDLRTGETVAHRIVDGSR